MATKKAAAAADYYTHDRRTVGVVRTACLTHPPSIAIGALAEEGVPPSESSLPAARLSGTRVLRPQKSIVSCGVATVPVYRLCAVCVLPSQKRGALKLCACVFLNSN